MENQVALEVRPEDGARPGDMVGFDICHLCLTFDIRIHATILS